MKTNIFYLSFLCLFLTISFPASYAQSQINCTDNQVIGVDIIQEKVNSSYFLIQGEGCGQVTFTVYNTKGAFMAQSELLSEPTFKWSVNCSNWPVGQYFVVVESTELECLVSLY